MPIPVLMPALSPAMTTGNVARWIKSVGDVVKPGDVIAEIETDKATMELEATDAGVLTQILTPAGSQNVEVNQPIAILLKEGEAPSASAAELLMHSPAKIKPEIPKARSSTQFSTPDTKKENQPTKPFSRTDRRIVVSPLARRVARANNIELTSIRGSGPNGRITKHDILLALKTDPAQPGPASRTIDRLAADIGQAPSQYKSEKVSPFRKALAARVTDAKQNIPHFYATIDCNVTALIELKSALASSQPDRKLSLNDFFIRACALALKSNPTVNSSWHQDEIRQWTSIDVSVAVAVPEGVITPIIRSADNKSVVEISEEMKRLVKTAQAGGLKPYEFQGGTFSLSNLGMYGVRQFEAIINPPQAAILAVGTANRCPIALGNEVAIATMVTCNLSADHRLIDGAVGAKFLSNVKQLLENPLSLLS